MQGTKDAATARHLSLRSLSARAVLSMSLRSDLAAGLRPLVRFPVSRGPGGDYADEGEKACSAARLAH